MIFLFVCSAGVPAKRPRLAHTDEHISTASLHSTGKRQCLVFLILAYLYELHPYASFTIETSPIINVDFQLILILTDKCGIVCISMSTLEGLE